MTREHTLDKSKVHYKWDKRNPPAIEIESGDTVHCETVEVTNNQVTPGCAASALQRLDFAQLYPLAGPVFVKGAEPGDILEVEILRLQTLDWGWAGLIPGLGLLAEDFTGAVHPPLRSDQRLDGGAARRHPDPDPALLRHDGRRDRRGRARSTSCRRPRARATSTRVISPPARACTCRSM